MEQFEDLRPYNDHEIKAAMLRISEHPYFDIICKYLFPDKDVLEIARRFREIDSIKSFQTQVMERAIKVILERSSNSFTYDGTEHLSQEGSYLFVSNHRDILLDSALLQLALYYSGLNTTEISFGSNLMTDPFIVDLGKSNRMYKVARGGSPRELYLNSVRLSRYIRHTITQKRDSIWIAQRNGRTKNGADLTDQGLIKMFSLSGGEDPVSSFSELNIVPVSISYQYETCDDLKTREIYISSSREYVKAPGEDLNSILQGVSEYKGDVHVELGKPIDTEDLLQLGTSEKNEFIAALTRLLTQRINQGYKLFDNNYIAYDLLTTSNKHSDKYSDEQKKAFIEMMEKKISSIDGDQEKLRSIYLGIYANPVKSKSSY